MKERLQDKERSSPNHQRFIYAGQVLKDDVVLDVYKIQKESTRHLVLNLCKQYHE